MQCPFYPDLQCTRYCFAEDGDDLCPSGPRGVEDLVDEDLVDIGGRAIDPPAMAQAVQAHVRRSLLQEVA